MESGGNEGEALELQESPQALIVRCLESEVTMFILPDMRMTLNEALTKKPPVVILDFSQTSFLDSSGVALLFKLQNDIHSYGGRFFVCGLRSSLRRVLAAVIRNDEIKLFDTLEEAQKTLLSQG